jgi:hypothetical protein
MTDCHINIKQMSIYPYIGQNGIYCCRIQQFKTMTQFFLIINCRKWLDTPVIRLNRLKKIAMGATDSL